MSADWPSGRILIVDDEIELMRALCDSLVEEGYRAKGCIEPHAALEELRREEYDLLLTDLMMPGMDGIQLLREALTLEPELIGIIMTGHGTVQTAVEAMKLGAFDYILKPFKLHSILPTLRRAMEVRRLKVENVRLKAHIEHLSFESARLRMVGSSEAMKKVLQMVEKVAGTDATVLIRGPSGSGKELVARALHHNGPRRDKPIVTVNCAALQETLLESELFGHERGAFTGAGHSKPGLFEVADGGTLFIDEIAEMSAGMQAKLLRVLEDGTFRRVGGTEERRANVRVIAATNKPLEEEQKAGRFRDDLFYRLNVITIQLPALRDRKEDIPELVEHFLTTRRVGRIKMKVDPAAMNALMAYHWPGNVRELANVIERAQILAEGDTITLDDLPDVIADAAHPEADAAKVAEAARVADAARGTPAAATVLGASAAMPTLASSPSAAPPVANAQAEPTSLREIERRHVAKILELHHGNKVHAARALGISRRALYRLIEKHKLDVPHR